jgi:hypothetical protein
MLAQLEDYFVSSSEIFNKFKFAGLHSPPLQNSFSLEVVLLQDVVHAPRPDQFCLRVGLKKVTTAALVQAGIDKAQA